jgi:RNA polymerase sigma-54 factor
MKLELTQKLQQQQILAPQMILSMDILLLPTQDLEQRIQKEFEENPALEILERQTDPDAAGAFRGEGTVTSNGSETTRFGRLESFQEYPHRLHDGGSRKVRAPEVDSKHEALQNTEGKPPGLRENLIQQLHLRDVSQDLLRVAEDIVNNLDHRGYLLCPGEELRTAIPDPPSPEQFDEALRVVRSLDPPGVGADNLQHCLLLQLERDKQDYPLEVEIIKNHLEDLGLNRIPKIAKELGATVDDIKDCLEIISRLDPHPGSQLEPAQPIYIRPDVVVEEVDGELVVRVEDQTLPALAVSDSCRDLLKASRRDRPVADFLRRKIESAQWLIQAVQQRQRTIHDIALAMVEYQRDFMLKGPEQLKVMKMQTIADIVGVHISTISRAIKGKYILTPFGTFELRYFFTGGVGTTSGEVESRRNICRLIREIVAAEDKSAPYSDTDLAKVLRDRGLNIARRTVTKYREHEGIPASRLRKEY